MAELGNLVIAVDSTSVPQATASLKSLSTAAQEVQASTDSLAVKQDALAQSSDRQTASVIRNSTVSRMSTAEREDLIKANERLIVKQDAYLQSLDRQAATMGRGAVAMRAYKAEQLGLTDSKIFQNLNGQIADLEATAPSAIDKMATRIEGRMGQMVLRMGVHMALITGAVGGVKWVLDELTTSTEKWADIGNKAIDTGASQARAIGGIAKAMDDERSARQGLITSHTDLAKSQERQNVLRAEMMAQGPEYRNSLVGENGLWSDQLILLRHINAERLKATNDQIARMELTSSKPTGSWKVGLGAAGALGALSPLLMNSGVRDDVEANVKYNEDMNKLYKSRAELMKSGAELDGAYSRVGTSTGTEDRSTQYGKEIDRLKEQLLALTVSERDAYEMKLKLMDNGASGGVGKAMDLYDQINDTRNANDARAEADAKRRAMLKKQDAEDLRIANALSAEEGKNRGMAMALLDPGIEERQKLNDTYKGMVDLMNQGYLSQQRFAYGEQELLRRTRESLPVMTDMFGNLRDTITDWSKRSTDAFVDFCFTGKNSFGDLISSMLRDLARLAVQRNVMEPLFNGLFGIGGLLNPGVNAGPGSVPTGMNYAGTLANPGGSGSIESNVSVTINSSGQAESSIVGNSTELGKRIDDAVRGVLISEKRQGGLLAAS